MTAPVALSLGEIEALALKAARGAGMTWGLAEEAAFAAVWLARQGLDGLDLLARLLDRRVSEGVTPPPVFGAGGWSTGSPARLCPIAAGTALADHFDLPQGPIVGAVRLGNLSAPLLVLPFLAAAAARAGVMVTARWAGCRVVLGSGAVLAVTGDPVADHTTEMIVTTIPAWPVARPLPAIPMATLQALQAHVRRTHVPASEQSRRGAGATGIDDL